MMEKIKHIKLNKEFYKTFERNKFRPEIVAEAKKVYLSQRQLKWSVLIRFYC